MPDERVTLRKAAERLRISEGAIRKRVKRGQMQSELGEDGRRYVYLNESDNGEDGGTDTQTYSLTTELKEQLAYLRVQLDAEREANRENRRIIAALTSRIPALEAPQEALGSGESSKADTLSPTQQPAPRPWWRKVFG